MPDDFVLAVRQISQFPAVSNFALPSDTLLVQRGGVGGPYESVSAWRLVQGSTGIVLPPDNGGSGLVTAQVSTPLFGPQGFNFYSNQQGGLSTLRNGAAGMWLFDGTTLSFNVSPPGIRGQPIPSWTSALQLTDSELSVPGSITVARPPCSAMEVATSQWVYDTIAAQIAALLDNPVEFKSNVQIDGTLDVCGVANLHAHLNVTCGIDLAGSQTITGDLAVGGNTTLDGTLLVNGCAQFAGGIGLAGDLTTAGNVTIGSQLEVNDAALFDRGIYVEGGATICGNQSLSGTLAVGSSMCVNGYAGFESDIGVLGDADVLGNLDVSGKITSRGKRLVTKGVLRREIDNAIDLSTMDILFQVEQKYAPIHSPDFTGMPTGPTPEVGSDDAKLATTAFVMRAVVAATTGVASFNTRTGTVTLTTQDVLDAGGAPIHSPHFTGEPEAEDPEPGTDSNIIATTHWVNEAIAASRNTSVVTFNHRVGHVELTLADIEDIGGAPTRNPTFLGSAHSPTPEAQSNDTHIATTAFVHRAVDGVQGDLDHLADHVVTRFNQRTGDVRLRASDISAAGGALLASPHFVGIPTAPTAPPQTDTNQLATTKYVDAAIASNPGPPGIQGPQGNPGPPGKGFTIVGTVDTQADLPTTGNMIGDVWMVDDTGDGWVWDGTRWKSIGHIRGAKGEPGEEGPPGPVGSIQLGDQPTNPSVGDLWWNGSTLMMWNGSAWVATADTSGYLPLSGGTLTGALNGGDATFNNTLNVGAYLNVSGAATIANRLTCNEAVIAASGFSASGGYINFLGVIGLSLSGSYAFFDAPIITMPSVPTSDPAVAGRLWNDGGTLKVSAG